MSNNVKTYDVVIIGAGPSGLTAAVYLTRAGRSVAVVEKIPCGGAAGVIDKIVNYPGFESVSGYELIDAMMRQAKNFGAEIVFGEAISIGDKGTSVKLADGDMLNCKAVILAAGCKAEGLGLPREDEYLGQGVSYCATCDGGFYRGKTVAVAGFGEKAVRAAEYLKNIAAKVYLITEDDIAADGAEKISGTVTELIGKPLEKLKVVKTGGDAITLGLDGLFVAAGFVPLTKLLAGRVKTDGRGYIFTDENMATDEAGVFAAGDVRHKNLRQIVTAASDGAIAATAANKYVALLNRRG